MTDFVHAQSLARARLEEIMRRYNWDDHGPAPPHAARRAEPSAHRWEDPDSDDDETQTSGPVDWCKLLLEFLVALLLRRCISARDFCSICFYLAKLGISTFEKHAMDPDLPKHRSGHYNRLLQETLPFYKYKEKLAECHLFMYKGSGATHAVAKVK